MTQKPSVGTTGDTAMPTPLPSPIQHFQVDASHVAPHTAVQGHTVTINPQTPGAVQGYKTQPQENVDLVNEIKAMETDVAILWKKVRAHEGIDRRMHALARTHFEDGFMWLVRSVFQPETEFDRD